MRKLNAEEQNLKQAWNGVGAGEWLIVFSLSSIPPLAGGRGGGDNLGESNMLWKMCSECSTTSSSYSHLPGDAHLGTTFLFSVLVRSRLICLSFMIWSGLKLLQTFSSLTLQRFPYSQHWRSQHSRLQSPFLFWKDSSLVFQSCEIPSWNILDLLLRNLTHVPLIVFFEILLCTQTKYLISLLENFTGIPILNFIRYLYLLPIPSTPSHNLIFLSPSTQPFPHF